MFSDATVCLQNAFAALDNAVYDGPLHEDGSEGHVFIQHLNS